jgi:hypothetical protein
MRGPTTKEHDPMGTAMLELTRPMMIVAALYARRSSLMARPEWCATAVDTSSEDY